MNLEVTKKKKKLPSSKSNLSDLYNHKYYLLWNMQKLTYRDPGESFIMSKKISENLLTSKDFLRKEIEERFKEKERNFRFEELHKKNLAHEVRKVLISKKMNKMKNKIFQKLAGFKLSQDISNLEFEKNKLSKDVQNYISSNRIKFASAPNKKKLTKIVTKLKELINKKNKKLLDEFFNIKFFKEILGKEKDYSRRTNTVSNSKDKKNLTLSEFENKNLSELYKTFYEINQDNTYFSNFYKNLIKNNYSNKNLSFDDLPFYYPNLEVLERFKDLENPEESKKEEKKINEELNTNMFCLDLKDDNYGDSKIEEEEEIKEKEKEMEIEEEPRQIKETKFEDLFVKKIYDPIIYKNENKIKKMNIKSKMHEFLLNAVEEDDL